MAEVLYRKFVKPSSISESLKCIICSDVYVQATRLYCTYFFSYLGILSVMYAFTKFSELVVTALCAELKLIERIGGLIE